MKNILSSIIFSIFLFSLSNANEKVIFDFTENELSTLEVRKVRGADAKTIYTIGKNENGNYLKAVADNAASGLGKEIKIDLDATPYINITWKVEKDLKELKKIQKKDMILLQEFLLLKKQVLRHYQIELLIMFILAT